MQNIEIQYFVFYPHAFSIPFIEWKIAYLIKTNTKLFRKFTIESLFYTTMSNVFVNYCTLQPLFYWNLLISSMRKFVVVTNLVLIKLNSFWSSFPIHNTWSCQSGENIKLFAHFIYFQTRYEIISTNNHNNFAKLELAK